ncbi:ATP-grasp domain-containing protein [Streptomyces luteocolor]|uniref:ATP-grasp domain-containing protein n=1 Tax=Streptomyces luteocolor TaxID=285500 RepID=UPI000853D7A1|nr:ATP-grasp domain-containing protein [Streptomyces luteocolor]
MSAGFLLPSDPLRAARPDPGFAPEAEAARACGAEVALVDHDALLAGDAAGAVGRVPRGSGPYWYRGWMMPVARYEELSQALAGRGCALLTPSAAYGRAHELPGWYDVVAEASLTSRSVWCAAAPGAPPPAGRLAELVAPLGPGPGIVKDYVKSRKHEWDEACFVPDLTDGARLSTVVERLFALQDESLAGGLVVRAYEPFVAGGEARVWWLDGEVLLVTAHPDTPERLPSPELDGVRAAVAALGCRFVTTDLALREDGRWRVVEVGDGQVSGLPRGARGAGSMGAADVLYAALAAAPTHTG